ncbi:MAG TPA: hypothetical protein VGO67_15670 [Verrucomicrobiae bacterium]|jgi:hypothetical protein
MSDKELLEIENRCNATQKGPWMAHLKAEGGIVIATHVETAVTISPEFLPDEIKKRQAEWDVQDDYEYTIPCPEADVDEGKINLLRFIAHSKQDVPKLIAEIRRLRSELDR